MRSTKPARRLSGALFSLSATAGGKSARFGIVVSKKVAVKAVDRNLIKRRIRAALHKRAGTVPPGTYVLVAKRDAAKASNADIERDIAALTARL